MSAINLLNSKLRFIHRRTRIVAITEMKIWEIPKSSFYPDGVKYSMFMVEEKSRRLLVGFDNHQPKGPHFHSEFEEYAYTFTSVEELIDDFWSQIERRGFIPIWKSAPPK